MYFCIYSFPGITQLMRKSPIALRLILRKTFFQTYKMKYRTETLGSMLCCPYSVGIPPPPLPPSLGLDCEGGHHEGACNCAALPTEMGARGCQIQVCLRTSALQEYMTCYYGNYTAAMVMLVLQKQSKLRWSFPGAVISW